MAESKFWIVIFNIKIIYFIKIFRILVHPTFSLNDTRIRGSIQLSMKRTKASSTKCAHPTCNERTSLRNIPPKIRREVLRNMKFYIPSNSKSCIQHSNYDMWLEIDAESETCENQYSIGYIEDILTLLCTTPKPSENSLPGKNYSHTYVF